MKKTVFLLLVLLSITMLSINSEALTIDDMIIQIGNEDYWFNNTLMFNQIIIDTNIVRFNNSIFVVESPNDINISIMFLHPNIASADEGDKVLDFYANTSGGTVYFNISGFEIGDEYTIERNNNSYVNVTADGTGYIRFTNNIWSLKHFEILVYETTPVASNPDTTGGSGGGFYVPPIEEEDTTPETTKEKKIPTLYIALIVLAIIVVAIFVYKRRD